jgi:thiol-disulfide isomerase/thioredoxin
VSHRYHRLLPAAVAAVAAVVLTACSGSGGTSSGDSGITGDGSAFVKGNGTEVIVPIAQRRDPIQLSAKTLAGGDFNLATLRGKPVVLNVWGSWCAPCRSEAAALQAASTALNGQASFLGIDTRDDNGQAQAFERKFGVTYPSVVDTGALLLNFHGAVSPQSIPTTLVLDQQGRVAARFTGPVDKTTIVEMVQDITKGSTAS